jgi:hypothetical protein
MRTQGFRFRAVLLLIAFLTSFAFADCAEAAEQKDIYDLLPGDAPLVVFARNAKSISGKIGAVAKRRGSEKQWKDEALDPLASVIATTGAKNGIRADGDVGFAMWVKPQMEMLVLVPVSNYEQFLGNFPQVQVQGDLQEIKVQNTRYWCTKREGYAALALAADTLKRAQVPAEKLPESFADTLKMDVVYITRPAEFFKALAGENPMQMLRDKALADFDNPPANWPEMAKKLAPVLKPLVARGMDVYGGMAMGTSKQIIGLSLSDDGFRYRAHYGFEPKSDAGRLIATLKNSDEPLLANLPDEKYVAFGGVALGDRGGNMLNELLDPVIQQWKTQGEDAKPLMDLAHALMQTATPMRAVSFGVMVQPRKDQAPVIRGSAIISGDSRNVVAGIRSTASAANSLMEQFKTGVKIEAAQGVVRIGNTTFDRVRLSGLPAGTPEVFINAGAIDPKTTLVTVALDSAWLDQAARAARDGKNTMSANAGVRAVDAMLPKARLAVVYTSPAELFKVMQMQGAKDMPELSPDLPPAGIAFTIVDSDLRLDMAVPQPTSDTLIDLFVTKVIGPPPAK